MIGSHIQFSCVLAAQTLERVASDDVPETVDFIGCLYQHSPTSPLFVVRGHLRDVSPHVV